MKIIISFRHHGLFQTPQQGDEGQAGHAELNILEHFFGGGVAWVSKFSFQLQQNNYKTRVL